MGKAIKSRIIKTIKSIHLAAQVGVILRCHEYQTKTTRIYMYYIEKTIDRKSVV